MLPKAASGSVPTGRDQIPYFRSSLLGIPRNGLVNLQLQRFFVVLPVQDSTHPLSQQFLRNGTSGYVVANVFGVPNECVDAAQVAIPAVSESVTSKESGNTLRGAGRGNGEGSP